MEPLPPLLLLRLLAVDSARAGAADVKNLRISGSEAWVSSSNVPQAVTDGVRKTPTI